MAISTRWVRRSTRTRNAATAAQARSATKSKNAAYRVRGSIRFTSASVRAKNRKARRRRAFAVVAYAVSRIPGVGDVFSQSISLPTYAKLYPAVLLERLAAPARKWEPYININRTALRTPAGRTSLEKGRNTLLRVGLQRILRHDVLGVLVRPRLIHVYLFVKSLFAECYD